jgi:mono/diheme cytochrome c family protein
MKKVLKWIGIVLGALVGLILLAAIVLFISGNSRLQKTYSFNVQPIPIPTDAASIERGKHRVTILCAGCHGPDLGGVPNWFNGGPLGTVDSANLTSGEGGIGQKYQSIEDYVRAIRQGVNPDGKPIFMPAVVSLNRMSDKDLGEVLAYVKSVPPVNRQTRGHQFTPLAAVMFGAGMFPKLPVEVVDHAKPPESPTEGVNAEYGGYLMTINDCRVCHGQQLAGGKHPDPTKSNVIVPNLTPGGDLAGWTADQFINTIRTGFTPDKRPLSPELMPWKEYSLSTDDELKAMFLYLQSLPSLPQVK